MTDDTPTIIFDLGSYNIRAGLESDKTPQFVIPSAFPTGEHDFPLGQELPADCTPEFAITDGEVESENRMNYIFASAFDTLFPPEKPEPTDLRVVFTNPPYSSKKHMQYMAQTAFELLIADSIIMKPPALFSLILTSLPTCVCVDIGYDVTHVVPIQHNYVCSPAVLKTYAAGSALDLYTSADQFNVYNVQTWGQMEQARKRKEELAYVSMNFEEELNDPVKTFPVTCGEMLFNPSLFEAATPEDKEPDERVATLMEEPSLSELIMQSIEKCDLQNRGTLWSNIVVTGGTSNMKGLKERLLFELKEIAPKGNDIKLRNIENPSFSAWEGEKLCIKFSKSEPWMTKNDYEEDPDSIFRKFVQYGIADPNAKKEDK